MIPHVWAILADTDPWGGHMGWGGWWMVLWGTFTMVALLVLVVWLVRAAAAPGSSHRTTGDPLDHARRILAERYARGELTSDEYRERVDQLR